MAKISCVESLRELYKAPVERAQRKVLDHIDEHCARFISLSPFCILGTQGAAGDADVSPRGDGPGFIAVLDSKHIALPDRPGNNRLDSLENILANPTVGLLFLIPGVQETLRINGIAAIHDDDDLRGHFEVSGRQPATVMKIEVREAYLHCAKSIMRSHLWDADARLDRSELPSMNKMIQDQVGSNDPPESQEEMIERYKAVLY